MAGSGPRAEQPEPLAAFGRYAGPATLILSGLADGTKHGDALTKDIETFAGRRTAPGTLYEALARLERQGLIEAVESDDRRRPCACPDQRSSTSPPVVTTAPSSRARSPRRSPS